MTSSHPPASGHRFSALAAALDPRSAPRLAWLFLEAVVCHERLGGLLRHYARAA